MRITLETERLILRPMEPDDAEAAFRWCGDPAVNTYMIYPLYHRAEDVRTWLEGRNTDDPDNYDMGIVLKATGELIGSGGLTWHPERNAWEIGYNLRADQWGHGYTVEMLRALTEHIRTVRPVEAIDGIFAAANHKSRRVMEKLGMRYVRDTSFTRLDGSETFPAKYYRRNLPQPAGECGVCDRIAKTLKGENPFFVRELETGYVVIGDHQRFEGYTLLLCREHATELDQLAPDFRAAFLRDMALTAEAVQAAFHPDKLNYELLGQGKGRHMHWHIFPRRKGDMLSPGPVWLAEDLHDARHVPSAEKLEEMKKALNRAFDGLAAGGRETMTALEAISARRSYRGEYLPVTVPREDLRKILQAGLDAPSGCNRQTTSLIAVDEPAVLEKLRAVIDPPVAVTAPAVICVLTRRINAYRDRCFATQDYSAAIENMLLAAVALGYQSCWYEGHITDEDRIGAKMAAILKVPEEYELVCMLPVGVAAGAAPEPKKKGFDERAWFNGFPEA